MKYFPICWEVWMENPWGRPRHRGDRFWLQMCVPGARGADELFPAAGRRVTRCWPEATRSRGPP